MLENQIIDWGAKGNLVRFCLGENGKQWGDDWNDCPYECNAGMVYEKFVKGHKDFCVEFEDTVNFPESGARNSGYSKKDFILRKVPFMIILPRDLRNEDYWHYEDFEYWHEKNFEGCKTFYFGDEV